MTAVEGFVGVVTCVAMGQHAVAALRRLSQQLAHQQHDRHHRQQAVRDGNVDILPFTASVAGQEGQKDADGRIQPAGHVGQLDARYGRGPVFVAHQVEDPGTGQVIDVVAGAFAIGAVLPVAGQRAVDDIRRDRTDRLVVDAQALDDPGPEALEDDIRLGRQFEKDLPPPRMLQIERDVLLVAADGRDHQAFGRIARIFDVDDAGAMVGQHHRGVGARQETRQVDDGDAF